MFTLSTSSPNIHQAIKESLSIQGTRLTTTMESRPQTMATFQETYHRDHHNSDDSKRTIVLGKTERQTAIKIESLERRLQANEKNRRETEAELETFKRKYQKVHGDNEQLRSENVEIKKELEEFRIAEKDFNVKIKGDAILLAELTEKLDNIESDSKEIKEQIAAILLENENELNIFEMSSNNILKLVAHERQVRRLKEKEIEELDINLKQTSDQLAKSHDHVMKLLQQVELVTKSNLERIDIQKEEIEIETEAANHLKTNFKKMEEEAAERRKNLDVMTAELRLLKKQKRDFKNNERSNQILLQSLETERQSFLETLSTLLGLEVPVDGAEIKRRIRQLQKESDDNKTIQTKLERDYNEIEEQLLDQAKQQRNALFRARTAEEEQSVLQEKIQSLLQEIKASDLVIKEKDAKIEQFESILKKINSSIGLQTENGPKELIDRIQDLAIYESLLQKTRPNPTTLQKLASSGKPSMHAVAHTLCGKTAWDRWDQHLLTAVRLESIKAADNEKVLRRKLSEKEKKIRELEKERKEVKSQKFSRNSEGRLCSTQTKQKMEPGTQKDEET